jgi:uncharacterized membrane protein YtjA (UPF0391 family)
MLMWAVLALAIAILSGALGYTGVVQSIAGLARVLFAIFLLIATLLFVLLMAGVDITRPAPIAPA